MRGEEYLARALVSRVSSNIVRVVNPPASTSRHDDGRRAQLRVSSFRSRFRANERDRATLFRRFPRRASGPTQPRDPSQRDIASRRRSTRARPPVGPGSSRARPCSPRRRSIVATRDPIAQSEKGRKYPREISRWANRPSKRRFGFVFFWFGVGLPNNGRGHLTKRAPRISDLRVRVSSSSFHRTPIARTQGLPPPPP